MIFPCCSIIYLLTESRLELRRVYLQIQDSPTLNTAMQTQPPKPSTPQPNISHLHLKRRKPTLLFHLTAQASATNDAHSATKQPHPQ